MALTVRKEIGTCFEKGKRVEKVDAAFGVVGGDDARGFSGLGPPGRSYTRR